MKTESKKSQLAIRIGKLSSSKTLERLVETSIRHPQLVLRLNNLEPAQAVELIVQGMHDMEQMVQPKKTLSPQGVKLISQKLNEYPYNSLPAAEWNKFCEKLALGEYGDFYENVNVTKVWTAFIKFWDERIQIVEHIRNKDHHDWKSPRNPDDLAAKAQDGYHKFKHQYNVERFKEQTKRKAKNK